MFTPLLATKLLELAQFHEHRKKYDWSQERALPQGA